MRTRFALRAFKFAFLRVDYKSRALSPLDLPGLDPPIIALKIRLRFRAPLQPHGNLNNSNIVLSTPRAPPPPEV